MKKHVIWLATLFFATKSFGQFDKLLEDLQESQRKNFKMLSHKSIYDTRHYISIKKYWETQKNPVDQKKEEDLVEKEVLKNTEEKIALLEKSSQEPSDLFGPLSGTMSSLIKQIRKISDTQKKRRVFETSQSLKENQNEKHACFSHQSRAY
jgi:hypothetical protein